jgi:hypothetical protein
MSTLKIKIIALVKMGTNRKLYSANVQIFVGTDFSEIS